MNQAVILKILDKVNLLQVRYPILLWITGLQVPSLLLTLLSQVKIKINKNTLFKPLVRRTFFVFLLILVSSILSIRFEFFSFERFAASLQNLLCVSLLICGYVFAKNNGDKLTFFPKTFSNICYLILIITILSFIFEVAIEHRGLFFFFTDNKFTFVKYNRLESFIISSFPRTTILTYYPNGTAILLIIIYCISYNFQTSNFLKNTILLDICLALTGSRLAILLGILLTITMLIKSKTALKRVFQIAPGILFVLFILIEYLLSYRQGSASTRGLIYLSSLNFMLDVAPLTGIGIKPIVPEVTPHYPLGSHSTVIGALFRLGIIGGGIVIIYYLLSIKSIVTTIVTSVKKFNKQHLINAVGLLCIILMSFAEDMDTHALTMFYVGILVYLYEKNV